MPENLPSVEHAMQCRICSHPSDDEHGPLVVPCCCIGSSRYAHSSCLSHQRVREGLFSTSFWECSVCGAEYRMKQCGHWLQWLATPTAISLLSLACSILLVVAASEIFRILLPVVDFAFQTKPKDGQPNESFEPHFYLNDVDLAYWVGGLLVITLGRKIAYSIQTRGISDLLQYVTFVPGLLSMSNKAEMQYGVWIMLCVYTFYNTGFVIMMVFGMMKVLSSLIVGETTVDFMTLPVDNDQTNTAPDEVCDNESELCICCWDMRAQFMMKGCGHLSACTVCRRRLVYRQLKLASGTTAVPPMRLLTENHLNEVKVKCPLCRALDVMVPVCSSSQD